MDKYTKAVLTIIAVCLIALTVRVWVPEQLQAHSGWDKFKWLEEKGFQQAVTIVVEEECEVGKLKNYVTCNRNLGKR